ncbi:alpha-tectorin-like [Pelobates fuscus]|uniref:alpha-tectorin-like n=1 Tax=Pelobates fuscus TaxID=191477 RepID=UPI002FE4561E
MENGKPRCIPLKVDACWASGDPHYTTFDTRYYDFMGTCTYTLVNVTKDAAMTLKRFTVLAKNDNRGNIAVSYVALVTFKTSGYTIDIKKGEVGSVRINNVMSLLPVNLNSGTDSMINIFQSGNTAIIQFTTDVMVSYDWDSVVRIELTRRYSKNVDGMCGNYNQDPADDFQMPSGSQAPNAIEFGKSWKVNDGTQCWDDCNGPCLPCLPAVAETFKKDDYCGLIAKKDNGPFSACHALVDPSRYMDNCVLSLPREQQICALREGMCPNVSRSDCILPMYSALCRAMSM